MFGQARKQTPGWQRGRLHRIRTWQSSCVVRRMTEEGARAIVPLTWWLVGEQWRRCRYRVPSAAAVWNCRIGRCWARPGVVRVASTSSCWPNPKKCSWSWPTALPTDRQSRALRLDGCTISRVLRPVPLVMPLGQQNLPRPLRPRYSRRVLVSFRFLMTRMHRVGLEARAVNDVGPSERRNATIVIRKGRQRGDDDAAAVRLRRSSSAG